MKARLNSIMNIGLCLVRKWWRPLVCIGMGLSLIVNGVVLPIMTKQPADLSGLASLVLALAPFAWLRTSEKRAGVAHQDAPLPPSV